MQALAACVAEWERQVQAPSLPLDATLSALVHRSRQLEAPSRALGFGGAGHHLSELLRLAASGAPIVAIREQLAVVRELLSSAQASLVAGGMPGAPVGGLAPPPLLSGVFRPSGPPVAEPAGAAVAPPRFLTSFGARAPVVPGSSPPAVAGPPAASSLRPAPIAAPPVAAAPPVPGASPARGVHEPVAAAPSRPGPPNLLVRSVLGLRAFGRKESAIPAGSAGAEAPPPPAPQPSLLGLGNPRSPSTPPPVHGGYGGLSPVAPPRVDSAPPLPTPLPHRQSTSSRSSLPPRAERVRTGGGRARHRPGEGENRWWVGALAALGVCLVVLGIVLVTVTLMRRSDAPPAATSGGTTAGPDAASSTSTSVAAVDSSLPRSKLLTDDERFRSLLAQVHGRGGKETPELRALLDEQAAIASQALQPNCVGPQCAALKEVGKLVTETSKKRVQRRSRPPDAMRSRWLAGLEMPEIPIEDDPRVQRRFEFYTENPLGRETFQQMLFRCGAYKDAIQSALIRRGLPKDLIAVAYAESSCYPLAKSPVGAEGLWQFIPDAARAYHLRIIEGTVDERHSPQKSTDAAIQYFSDLYAKFGSWDLVFCGYNMGPFGLAARLSRVEGDNVGFWELVDAEMLPGETADYAPAIQAIALILNNLQKLKFGGIQQRAPQMTMELVVPPSSRLTLIARAAAMSVDELRRLNLDIKGNATPGVSGFAVHVPKDSVWQARETLAELIKSKDESDLCAPQNFDWGRQRFTPAMQEACTRSLGARGASSSPSAAAPAAVSSP